MAPCEEGANFFVANELGGQKFAGDQEDGNVDLLDCPLDIVTSVITCGDPPRHQEYPPCRERRAYLESLLPSLVHAAVTDEQAWPIATSLIRLRVAFKFIASALTLS